MKNLLVSSLCLFLLFTACEKTVDSETNRWNNNQATLKRLMSEYPNFKVALEAQLAEAESMFKNAANASNEEAKIEMMAKANSAARPTYVRELDDMDEKIEELREAVLKLVEDGGEKELLVAGIKFNSAESAIIGATTYIKSVTATDKFQAAQAVDKGLGKIERMTQSIEKRIAARAREMAELEEQPESELVQ